MTTIKLHKNGAWTTFDDCGGADARYIVKLYGTTDNLLDKVRCDDYRDARAYLRSFNKIAKVQS